MPGPAFASGDSVSLHPVEEEDYEFLQYGRNNPDIRRPLGSSTIYSRGDVAEMVEDDEYRFLVCVDEHSESTEERNSGPASSLAECTKPMRDASHDHLEPVGVVALPWVFEDTQSAFLMYWIAPEHQGNGYATEATEMLLNYVFRECGFHKVAAYVHETNDTSAAVLESLGFQREGTLRQEVFSDGEWLDEYRYAVLADEWLE
ncbi:GNAT family N-acetyltransferase [Halopiger aswanensis]|uniref:RimJ/RimL family protein N-acetyltransferase n=1 Tax=Halopiger aswanensis TaxID=148449 RepID=A0A3R7GEW9_9EURY|nr:GNAT family protein [Halopiger aswanensis]RKD86268.1 RimJ/RimL family protein N-acetyltransferase [Halopiger aswanensis]